MTDHKQNPAEIFLVEVFDGEDYSNVWCDTPAPGEGMREEDATRYVRADLVPQGNDILAKRIVELTGERDALAAQLASKTDIANQLKDGLAESFEKQMELKAQLKQLRELLIRAVKSEQYIIESDLIAAIGSDLQSEISEAIDATPTQCLAEIRAQAGRDGFIAGVNATGQGYNGEHGLSADEIMDLAELYVTRKVRQSDKEGR